jgi:hypothetical protein
MYSALPSAALDDFLTIAAPSAGCLNEPPNETTEAGKSVKEEMRETCRAALATDDGWPVEALFRLRKILETAIHLGVWSRDEVTWIEFED